MKKSNDLIFNNLVIIRGAGDLATAVAIRLFKSGFPVICLDIEKPTVIRRTVSFAEAMFSTSITVESVTARRCAKEEVLAVLENSEVPVVIDPSGSLIEVLKPTVVVDAIIAKKNLGTRRDMAPLTIALGPGFTAKKDVDVVIETSRGHELGKLIYDGSAKANTGIPGNIAGFTTERVIHSHCEGIFKSCSKIGDIVKKGDIIAKVGDSPIYATIDGMIRGLLHDDLYVPKNFKIADIDPRGKDAQYTTCSDKARSLSGSVLEAIMHFLAFGN